MSGSDRPPEEGRGGPPVDPAILERFKEFRLTSFAVGHRTSVVMLFVFITVAGLFAYRSIPKESAPEVPIPILVVNTMYPGVSPADIETLVTRPLEDELNTISDVKELRSTSVEGYSSIEVEFETTVNLDDALARVREKVDLAKPELPADAEEPSIIEINVAEFPIMQVNVAGEYGLVRLKEVAEDLQDRIEQIPAVLRVELRGGLEREVQVDVDLTSLKYYGLALTDVVDAIRNENVNIPGGSIDVGELAYLLRVDGEFADPSVIEDLVVATVEGRAIYVRDLATVDFGFAERTSFARLDGVPVVTLDVVKRAGENIIETADRVKAIIAEMEATAPPTTRISITSDQSRDIHMMVSSLENNIVSGLILIVAVLLFFLGVRNSVFVAISIPTSMLLSFVVLSFLGVTMNMVVLFSLILALGMLVDNAIVIVENIHRYVEEGWHRALAARKATGEVAVPVIAATVTTLAAFAPLLFWPGVTGEFMKYLPITLIVTLSSSLFVAMVIVPTLCAMFMDEGAVRARSGGSSPAGTSAADRLARAAGTADRGRDGASAEARGDAPGPVVPVRNGGQRIRLSRTGRWAALSLAAVVLLGIAAANWLTALLLAATVAALLLLHRFVLDRAGRAFQERWVPGMVSQYERRLRWALDHRAVILGGTGVAFVVTVLLFANFNNGVEFFPEDIPPVQALVTIETPVGTRAEFTDRVARVLEEEIPGVQGTDDAESVVTTVGGGGNIFFGGPSATNQGRITLQFVDYELRGQDSHRTLALLQQELGRDIAGAEISVDAPDMGPPSGPPVNIEVSGDDPVVLKALSDEILSILRNRPVVEKLVGLESDMDEARSELAIRVDRERASLFGLSTSEVGHAIRGAVQGVETAKYRTGNDEYDIVVRLAERDRQELSALEDLVVVADGGAQIPLVSVADWEVTDGYGSIRRKDMDRMATISADVRSGLNSNAVLAEVQEELRTFAAEALPPGYRMNYTGQVEDQEEAADFLMLAFGIALMLIAFILVSQFNSVVKPVIILTSVIMSTIGVLVGLMVFRMPFVIVMTGVGIISLAGIVVNNAIVLIDYIDILRKRDGMDRREALVQGGMTRFRPVILTAVTTALGLVPLAIGLNFDFFGLYGSLSPELYWGGEQAAWWSPMAIAVIVGILFATFLTLVVVPVMYSVVDDASDLFRRSFLEELDGEEVGQAVPSVEGSGPGGGVPVDGEPVGAPAGNGGRADGMPVPAGGGSGAG